MSAVAQLPGAVAVRATAVQPAPALQTVA